MTGPETFWWGAVGGAAAWVFVFLFPELRYMAKTGKTHFDPNPVRIIGTVGYAVFSSLLAGLIAVVIGDATQIKHAVAYGIGWEAAFKGLSSAGSAVTAP